jgi:hypothetical protein
MIFIASMKTVSDARHRLYGHHRLYEDRYGCKASFIWSSSTLWRPLRMQGIVYMVIIDIMKTVTDARHRLYGHHRLYEDHYGCKASFIWSSSTLWRPLRIRAIVYLVNIDFMKTVTDARHRLYGHHRLYEDHYGCKASFIWSSSTLWRLLRMQGIAYMVIIAFMKTVTDSSHRLYGHHRLYEDRYGFEPSFIWSTSTLWRPLRIRAIVYMVIIDFMKTVTDTSHRLYGHHRLYEDRYGCQPWFIWSTSTLWRPLRIRAIVYLVIIGFMRTVTDARHRLYGHHRLYEDRYGCKASFIWSSSTLWRPFQMQVIVYMVIIDFMKTVTDSSHRLYGHHRLYEDRYGCQPWFIWSSSTLWRPLRIRAMVYLVIIDIMKTITDSSHCLYGHHWLYEDSYGFEPLFIWSSSTLWGPLRMPAMVYLVIIDFMKTVSDASHGLFGHHWLYEDRYGCKASFIWSSSTLWGPLRIRAMVYLVIIDFMRTTTDARHRLFGHHRLYEDRYGCKASFIWSSSTLWRPLRMQGIVYLVIIDFMRTVSDSSHCLFGLLWNSYFASIGQERNLAQLWIFH